MLIVWTKLIVALLLWLGLVDPARAEPISTAIGLTLLIEGVIGGAAIGGITAGAIGGALITGALGIGVSLLSRAFNKPTTADGNKATDSGVQTSLRVGADVPRNRIFGKQMLAGQLAYWNVFGPDNRWLQLVFVLGVGPHDLFGMFGDGKRLTLGAPVGGSYPITDYTYGTQPLGWVKFYNGFVDQAVEGELVDSAVPAGRWSASNTGVGVCYAYVKLFYWPEVFKNGIPQFQFEIGARCYDPRLDTSVGGSHVWSDQHTWQWSDNPAVVLYNFERGLYLNAQRVLGRGVAPQDMIRTMYIDAANVCDELVALKGGGTESRYRIGINVGADRDLKSVEQDITVAMAGSLVELAGAWGPLAGAAKEVVATITDDDFVTGKEIRFSQKKPRDQLVNLLISSYSPTAKNYQEVPYAPRTSSADESADGDRFQVRRDYPQIQSQTQAQRVGEIERRDGRYQATAGGTLPFKFSYVEAGDWIRWTSVRRNFDATFRVKTHRLSPDQMIELSLDQTDAAVFDFDETVDELDPLNPGDLPGIGALISLVPDFAMATMQLDGVGGLTIPALVAQWSPITDRTVDGVMIQYRIGTDDATIKSSPLFPPADGEGIITDGIQAATTYQARAVLTSTPARPMFWTDWLVILSAPNHVVPTAIVSTPIETVTLAMFEAGLKDYVGKQLDAQMSLLQQFDQNIASNAADQEAQNWLDNQKRKLADTEIVRQISAVTGGYTYRGDFVVSAIYYPNDLVRMPDGLLYYTNSKVQGVTPPAAPWVKQDNIALISQEWRQFAGPDGVASQTSSKIEARFFGTQPDGTTNDLVKSVASVSSEWNTYAGPLGAQATSDEVVKAINGTNTVIAGTTTLASAINGKLGATWQVVLDVNGYVSGVKAYNDGSNSLFTIITDSFLVAKPGVGGGAPVPVFAIAPVDGTNKIVMRGDMMADGTITANKILAGSITGIKIAANTIVAGNIADGTLTSVQLAANTILGTNIAPGTIANSNIVDRTLAAVKLISKALTNNEIADGTIVAGLIAANQILATHVGANQIITQEGNIADLTVGTLKIKTSAITQAGFAGNGALFTVNNLVYAEALRVAVTIAATGGEQITLQVTGGFDHGVGSGQGIMDWYVELIETGGQMDGGQSWTTVGGLRVTVAGGTKFTASALGNTLTARVMVKKQSTGTNDSYLLNRRLNLQAFVK